MKNKKLFAIIAAGTMLLAGSSLTLTSCQDDQTPATFIEVDQTIFSLDAQGLDAQGQIPTFELGTNRSWNVISSPQWVSLNYTSGDRGRITMHIIAQVNDTDADRRGCIEIATSDSKPILLYVDQARVPGTLEVNKNSFNINLLGNLADGSQPTVTVTSSYPWTVESSDWLTTTPDRGEAGTTTLTIVAAPNDTRNTRQGRVTVTIGDVRADIAIQQDAVAFSIPVASIDVNLDGTKTIAGQALAAPITALEPWLVTDKPAWVTITPDHGNAGTTTVALTVEKNDGEPRQGNIELTSEHGAVTTLTITQEGSLPYDNKQVGHVYFNDPFDWCHAAAEEVRLTDPAMADAMDQMNLINGSGAKNLNIYDGKGLAYAPYFYSSQGGNWEVVKEYSGKDYVYILDGYLRLGASSNTLGLQTAVPLDIADGTCANVELTFKGCKNGTDKVVLVVELIGPGTIVGGQSAKLSQEFKVPNQVSTEKWKWQDLSVQISKATADTRVLIRPTVMDDKSKNSAANYQRRWLIDEVKITRTAN